MIGRDPEGQFRVVYPLFKIVTRYNQDQIPYSQWQTLNSSLSQIAEAMTGHDQYFVSPTVKSRARHQLSKNYLIGDFGSQGIRLAILSRENLGVYKNL